MKLTNFSFGAILLPPLVGATPNRPILVSNRASSNQHAVISKSGCGRSLPSEQTPGGDAAKVTIESSGVERSYLISIPQEYSPDVASPLILSFHGGDRTAKNQLDLDQLSSPDFNTVAIVVYSQDLHVSGLQSRRRLFRGQ